MHSTAVTVLRKLRVRKNKTNSIRGFRSRGTIVPDGLRSV